MNLRSQRPNVVWVDGAILPALTPRASAGRHHQRVVWGYLARVCVSGQRPTVQPVAGLLELSHGGLAPAHEAADCGGGQSTSCGACDAGAAQTGSGPDQSNRIEAKVILAGMPPASRFGSARRRSRIYGSAPTLARNQRDRTMIWWRFGGRVRPEDEPRGANEISRQADPWRPGTNPAAHLCCQRAAGLAGLKACATVIDSWRLN